MSMKSNIQLGISQWSFHRSILGNSRDNYEQYLAELHSDNPDTVLRGDFDHIQLLDAAEALDVKVIDLVNILFYSKVDDDSWLKGWKKQAEERQIEFNCLMCDELGNLAASDPEERHVAIEKHLRWLKVAETLGCRLFRVNAYGDGSYLLQMHNMAKSMRILAERSEPLGIQIVVENHGHPSSNAAWLAMLIEVVGKKNVGVYLDFDNFFMGGWHHEPKRFYDRTQGLEDLAPYTLGVSAKSYEFSTAGEETTVDYPECVKILSEHGFEGVIAAEYEGDAHSEMDGTKKTLELLRKIGKISR
ncbi:sugar phosphate isomerase/epimerase [Vibrio hannami]|uniref:sugar phosphate isomerase/epimerase family protein n=1 Tax=Vibrio hannami TaxID=2717094 RepID=UPI00240F1869|nr:sugar phosphate isomerase/epimerase family protein [Vibrio hannami]MDG3085325.1 sugar phosphate isomerase/epimerase [Vibrio hannami]